MKAPDFPTGGVIHGIEGVSDAFHTGRGRIVMRGRARFEETKTGREMIIVEEIPYQVNKADMVRKTADLVNDKKHRGHLRDSGRERPQRHAHRVRIQARCHSECGPQQAVQVHPTSDVILSQQHCAGEGSS